jgi:AcrR family transcriptional regulator
MSSTATTNRGAIASTAVQKRRSIGRPRAGDSTAVGREALIAAACDLLTRLPPAKVTRARVARAVNVDPSLIRYYFRDRATLLLAAFDRLTDDFQRMSAEIPRTSGGQAAAHQRLRARIKASLRLNFRYPYFHQLLIEEVGNMPDPAAREHMKQLTERGLASYDSILKAGAEDGSLRSVDVAFLYIVSLGTSHFFTAGKMLVQQAIGKREYNDELLEQYADFVCDLLLFGLAGKKA